MLVRQKVDEMKFKLKSCVVLTLCFFFFSPSAFPVQLDNWRLPYYSLAERLGRYSPSPSGMFWDDLGPIRDSCNVFNKSLWPDIGKTASNHWVLEPAGSGTIQNTNAFLGKNTLLRASLLNDILYKGFLTRQVVDIDSRFLDDGLYRGMRDRGIASRISEAYLQYTFKYGFARIGRINRNWGPFGDRSLVLSKNPYSYDAVEFGLHSSVFEFRHMFAAFPDQNQDLDWGADQASRYLTAHSLNFMLGKFGSIGVTETVVFCRNKGIPDLQYVNPVSIYFTTNTNGEGSGNLMETFQWHLHPFTDKISILGQVIIDDIQVDNKGPGDQEPSHWGGDFGIFWTDFLPSSLPHALSFEYRYCSRWLYTVADNNRNRGESYTYMGKSLGHPSNDNDSLNLSFSMAGNNFWAGCANIFYARQGENRVSSRWNDTLHPGALGYRKEPQFPSGTVQQSAGFTLEARGYFKNYVDASLGLCNRWIQNENNVSHPMTYSPTVSFSLNLHYGDFFIALPK
jgi:hypothetical protein